MIQGSDDGSVWDIQPDEDSAVPDVPPPTGLTPNESAIVPPVPAAAEPPAAPPTQGTGDDEPPRRRLWLLLALLVVALVVLGVVVATSGSDDDPSAGDTTSVSLVPATEPAPTTTELAPATTEPAPATTEPAPATTEPAPATTEPAPATTEPAPATTEPAPATTEPAPVPGDGPAVIATGREGVCRFGPDCLIADFEIDGFATQPTEFVCEFGSGSRFTFRFDSQAVEGACSTADAGGVIIIEVDGVRSNPVTR